MCTVSFVPVSNEKFIFTSNRDVGYKRKKASVPQLHLDLIYPIDGEAGGTWIVTSQKYTLCLLNGAFDKHDMNRSFSKSRGIVVLDAISHDNINDFITNYSLEGVEPFTLIIIENGKSISELRWDERKKHVKSLDYTKPHIWSSSTLYPPEIVRAREEWFSKWLQENKKQDMLIFHKQGGFTDSENDVIMDRGFIGTVSVTNMVIEGDNRQIQYYDLRNDIFSELNHRF